MRRFNVELLNKVLTAGGEDQEWLGRKRELDRLENEGREFPSHWSSNSGLLYYKNRLYIPDDDGLKTVIAKGCHDSKVAGHFGQKRQLKLSPGTSIGKDSVHGSTTTCDLVTNVNTISRPDMLVTDFYNHYKFHLRLGHLSPPTSSHTCRNHKGTPRL